MKLASEPRKLWAKKNKGRIEESRQEQERERKNWLYTSKVHKTVGRKSTYDSANPDHLLLDSIMPKEEASDIKYLSFEKLTFPWLRELAKKFIRIRATHQSRGQLKAHLQGLQAFSKSLSDSSPARKPEDLCRDDILDFISSMTQLNLKPQSKSMYLGTVKQFLETCALEGWGGIENKVYVYSTDYPRKLKHQPKAIPERTMAEIEKMIADMPEQLARKVVVLRDTGMRVIEMLTLPFDCLVQDSTKVIGLKYTIWKTKKEHQVPVSQAVIDVVTAQKNELILESKKRGTPLPKYLFPAPDGERYHPDTIRKMFKKYAKKNNLLDGRGEAFNFHPHRLRHTLATRMINNGVQQHVVQKMLGHESPVMTAVYAELNDRTLRTDFEKYQGRMINIYGQSEEDTTVDNSVDLKWLAKNINAQALPNGYCGIPVIMSDCPSANSCLTCTHFRTDKNFLTQHEAQLEETNKILETAQSKGWVRQIETNSKVKTSLERIVKTLKSEKVGE